MRITIRDDVIWAKQLASDRAIQQAVLDLPAEGRIRLKVDGIVGTWCKMQDGRDGRPTQGIKPVEAMATVWRRMQNRRGQIVSLEWADADAGDDLVLALADAGFDEWHSAEDEEAFGELRPV